VTTAIHWRDAAKCLTEDPELFFPTSYVDPAGVEQTMKAIGICLACPVRQRCLSAELAAEGSKSADNRHGIRGALTPGQRARITASLTKPTAKCGTSAGYSQHRRDKTMPCQPCRDAEAERARLAAAERPGRPVARCGSLSGYKRHSRLGERPCEPCRNAQRYYQWRKRQEKAAQQALAA